MSTVASWAGRQGDVPREHRATSVLTTCPLSSLEAGRTTIDGMVVVRHEGGLHAFPAHCPHGGAPLVDAGIVAGAVVCPLHGARFRLTDGRAVAGPTRARLAVRAVAVQEDDVLVLNSPPVRRRIGHLLGLWHRLATT